MSGVNNYNNPGYEYFNFLNKNKISKKAKDKETENNLETQDKAEAKTEKSALDKIKEKVKARNAGTTSQEEQKIDSGVVSYNIALNYNNSYNNLNFKKNKTPLIMDSSDNSTEAETQTKAKAEQTKEQTVQGQTVQVQGGIASGTITGEVIVNDSSKEVCGMAPKKPNELQSVDQAKAEAEAAQGQEDKKKIQRKNSSLRERTDRQKNGQTSYDAFAKQVEGEYNANAEQVVNQQNAFNQDVKQKQETFNQKVEQEHKANNEKVNKNYVDAQNKYTVVNDELLRQNGVQKGDTVKYNPSIGGLTYSSPDGTRSGEITLSRFTVECKDFKIEGLPDQTQVPNEQPVVAETPAQDPQTVTPAVAETGDSAAQQPDAQEGTTQETEESFNPFEGMIVNSEISEGFESYDKLPDEIKDLIAQPEQNIRPEGVPDNAQQGEDGTYELYEIGTNGDEYVSVYKVNPDTNALEAKVYSIAPNTDNRVELNISDNSIPEGIRKNLPPSSQEKVPGDAPSTEGQNNNSSGTVYSEEYQESLLHQVRPENGSFTEDTLKQYEQLGLSPEAQNNSSAKGTGNTAEGTLAKTEGEEKITVPLRPSGNIDTQPRQEKAAQGVDPSVRPGESVVTGYKTPGNVNIVTNQVGNNTQKTQTPDAATTKGSNNGESDTNVKRYVDGEGNVSLVWTNKTENGTVSTQDFLNGRKRSVEKDSDGNVVRVTDEYANGKVDVYKPNENGELERDFAEMLDAGYDNLIEEGLSDINSLKYKSNETNTATPRKDGLASDEEIMAWVNDIINDSSRDQAATVNLPIQPKEQAEASKKESEERQKAEAARQKAELERQKQQNLSWSNNNRGFFNTTLGDGGINDFASNNVTFDFFGNAQYSTFGQNISYYAMDDYSNMITRVRGSGNGGYGPHLA